MISFKARRGLKLIAIISFFLSSCSYGFFNFSTETGMIELNFDFTGVNVKNVDIIEYELTPPEGSSTSVEIEVKDIVETQSFDKADIGSWNIKITLFSSDVELQTFNYDIEVLADQKTSLRIEADWDSTEYVISYETWQYVINDDTNAGNTEISSLTFTKMQVTPGVIEDYYSGERLTSVIVNIIGEGFEDELSSFKLIYPDGETYEFGSKSNLNRGITFSHKLSDTEIEIKRIITSGVESLNGAYGLRMFDNQAISTVDEYTLDFSYEDLMPKIILPDNFYVSAGFSFGYNFGGIESTGTKFHYIIDAADENTVFGNNYKNPPDDDSLIGSDAGDFIIAANQLTAGKTYQFVCAAVQHYTVTPIEDSSATGGADFLPYSLADSFYNIYGGDTGYVIAKVVEFTAE